MFIPNGFVRRSKRRKGRETGGAVGCSGRKFNFFEPFQRSNCSFFPGVGRKFFRARGAKPPAALDALLHHVEIEILIMNQSREAQSTSYLLCAVQRVGLSLYDCWSLFFTTSGYLYRGAGRWVTYSCVRRVRRNNPGKDGRGNCLSISGL